MTLMDSSFAARDGRLVVLAPSRRDVTPAFRMIDDKALRYETLLAEMQRLRGAVYLADGAIERRELSNDGRHQLDIDEESWHVLTLDTSGAVCGCARLRTHTSTASFADLWIRNAAVARLQESRNKVRTAVESEMAAARQRAMRYVEVGGWAIAKERRCTMEALRVALATFGLAQVLGGCLGITTATVRHCSSSILRRIGGTPLQYDGASLPPYFDPQFRCQMEMLRFDSSQPNPRYQPWVERMQVHLSHLPVICMADRSVSCGFEPARRRDFVPPAIPVWGHLATA